MCGHALGGRSDERRVATVVFADIVGFTGMAEARDPEHVKELVDRCFERLAGEVTSFGGKVDKIVGDAMVALFGAPVAHGDDPERAVRAALRMQASVAEHARDEGVDMQVRIGVNTGEVLAGALRAGGEYTAMGDVVNTAQRLQSLAQPGTVLVGPATHAATREAIAYEHVGAVEVKGRDEPVDTWRATEPLLPPGYRPRRTSGPLLGRAVELRLLDDAVAMATSRRRGQLVVLLGEAGLGKSRLATEVACRSAGELGARVLEGRCVPYGEANVWWPLAEAIRQSVAIPADAGWAAARTATVAAVAEVLELGDDDDAVARLAEGLLHLMGYDAALRGIDPQRAREEAEWAALSYFEALARRTPLVLVLSDLHWAEPPVLDLVAALLDRLGRCPFVLVATARASLGERFAVPDARHNTTVVNVDPLDRTASALLLDQLTEHDLAPSLRDELLDRAGGNPLFLEELVALVSEDEARGLPSPGSAAGLPDTLRGLVAARIDGLSARERTVLADAAVWGHSGKVVVLEEMAAGHPGRTAAGVIEDLDRLVDRDILVVDGDRWSFRSELVREVAYGMLTKADRARTHAGIAWYLDRSQASVAEAPDRVVDVVAHHYEAAASIVAELGAISGLPADVVDRAVAWLEEAASRAERSQVGRLAVTLSTQALDLLAAADPAGDQVVRRADLLLVRARSRSVLRDLEAAQHDLDEAGRVAATVDDEGLAARLDLTRGDLQQKAGALRDAEASLRSAVERFARIGDAAGEVDALRALGLTLIFASSDAEAERTITESLERSRALGDRRGEAWALQHLAWISFVATRADEAEARIAESAATFAELGDPGGLVWAEGLLAFVKYQQGLLDEAGELGERVGQEARERGDRWGEGMMAALQAGVHLWSGRSTAAVRSAEVARDLFRDIGDGFGEAQAAVGLGRALVTAGEVDAGLGILEDGVARLGGTDESVAIATMATNGLAAALLQLGEPERAATVLGGAGAARDPLPAVGDVERVVAHALAAVQTGEAAAAVAELEPLVGAAEASPSTYAASALALALASAGAPVAEVERAAAPARDTGRGSYLDHFTAELSVAVARCAHHGADELAALDAVGDGLVGIDDAVAPAVLALARAEVCRALGLPGLERAEAEAAERWAVLGGDGHGWRRALAQGVASVPRPSAATTR